MKQTFALALLDGVGLAAAGCGSAKQITPTERNTTTILGPFARKITVDGSRASLQNVAAGTRLACKGWIGKGVTVPPRGGSTSVTEQQLSAGSWSNGSSGTTYSQKSIGMRLTHLQNGSIKVSCQQPK